MYSTYRWAEFQSTLPVGGATVAGKPHLCTLDNFNPRSPWGERPGSAVQKLNLSVISIHAPRGGSDGVVAGDDLVGFEFQSTLPVGGATCADLFEIHRDCDFNPRSPWGERPSLNSIYAVNLSFQSTLPVGGATVSDCKYTSAALIFQSTLPVGGATLFFAVLTIVEVFQSTLPVGGATQLLLPTPL